MSPDEQRIVEKIVAYVAAGNFQDGSDAETNAKEINRILRSNAYLRSLALLGYQAASVKEDDNADQLEGGG